MAHKLGRLTGRLVQSSCQLNTSIHRAIVLDSSFAANVARRDPASSASETQRDAFSLHTGPEGSARLPIGSIGRKYARHLQDLRAQLLGSQALDRDASATSTAVCADSQQQSQPPSSDPTEGRSNTSSYLGSSGSYVSEVNTPQQEGEPQAAHPARTKGNEPTRGAFSGLHNSAFLGPRGPNANVPHPRYKSEDKFQRHDWRRERVAAVSREEMPWRQRNAQRQTGWGRAWPRGTTEMRSAARAQRDDSVEGSAARQPSGQSATVHSQGRTDAMVAAPAAQDALSEDRLRRNPQWVRRWQQPEFKREQVWHRIWPKFRQSEKGVVASPVQTDRSDIQLKPSAETKANAAEEPGVFPATSGRVGADSPIAGMPKAGERRVAELAGGDSPGSDIVGSAADELRISDSQPQPLEGLSVNIIPQADDGGQKREDAGSQREEATEPSETKGNMQLRGPAEAMKIPQGLQPRAPLRDSQNAGTMQDVLPAALRRTAAARKVAMHRWGAEAQGVTERREREPGFDGLLITKLKSIPRVYEAAALLDKALARGAIPFHHYFAVICNRLAELGDVQRVQYWIQHAAKLGQPPSTFLYTFLIKACGRDRNLYALRDTVLEIERLGVQPNKVLYDTLIQACGEVKRCDDAWEVVARMEQAGIQPDIRTFTMIMDNYAEDFQPEKAVEVFQRIEAAGMELNAVTWTVLSKAWGRVRNVAMQRATMQEMERRGVKPPLMAWSLLVETYALASDYAMARKTVEEVKAQGFKLNAVILSSLSKAYGSAGQLAEARSVLKEMATLGIAPTKYSYISVAWWFAQAGDFEEVQNLYGEAAAKGIPVGRVGLGVIVEACMQAWWKRGRPADLLQKAADYFENGRERFWGKMQAFNSRAPQGTQIDLHNFGPWTAQFLLLNYLQTINERLATGWLYPSSDFSVVTGKGNHKLDAEQPVVRDVTIRFLQHLMTPKLAAYNDGLVVVRRDELLTFLSAVRAQDMRIDHLTFQYCFEPPETS